MTRHALGSRVFLTRLMLVALLALVLRAAWLPGQPPLGDDISAGASAVNFVERAQVGPTMWHHPRVRDLAVYASTWALGSGKLGLVFPSLLLGVLAVPVVGLLGRRLAGERAGTLAALLLAIDSLHVDYSRQAVQEVYTTFFGAAGVLLTFCHIDSRRVRWIVAAGIAFGLGLASKWSAGLPLAVALGYASWTIWHANVRVGLRMASGVLVIAALVVLPAAVYLATWAPWFGGGHDIAEWLHLQHVMALEATHHAGFNVADTEMPHRAILWFLWPVFYADSVFGPDGPIPIIAFSNPVTWLPTIPAIVWLARRAWLERSMERAVLPTIVVASWLPFAVVARPIWLHSALTVVPFSLTAVAAAASEVLAWNEQHRRRARAFVVAAVVSALPLYVLATGNASSVPGLRELALSYRPVSTMPVPPAP